MPTHGERFLRIIRDAIADAERSASVDHRADALNQALQRIGAALEVFLKSHAIPTANAHAKLVTMINLAATHGLSPAATSTLQSFRADYYNPAKHQPGFAPPASQALLFLGNAQNAIEELVRLNLGTSGDPFSATSKRLFWLGFWDHYIGGDTEVVIALPIRTPWLPISVDLIYVRMDSWNTLKAELPRIGTFRLGRDSMPHEIYDAWSKEGEFLQAGSFEGSYQGLITLLAKNERRENLLPNLKRENQPDSMLAACAFALVQTAQQGLLDSESPDELEYRISHTADDSYAAPCHSSLAQHFVKALAGKVAKIDPQKRQLLAGPEWLSRENFSRELTEGADRVANLSVAVTKDFRVVLELHI